MADDLEDLLHSLDEARVVDRLCQLDMTKVARALGHVLGAGLALELSVDRTKQRVVETSLARFRSGLIHGLGVYDVANTHALDLLGRKESELDLLYDLERRTGVREIKVRHLVSRG